MKISERNLINVLAQFANDGMTTESLKNSGEEYQEFSRIVAEWVNEVALIRYRGMIIANADVPYEEYLDDAVWKIIDRLDCVLKRPENERARYLMTVVSNLVTDKGRSYKRTNYVSHAVGNQKEYEKRFVSYDEIGTENLPGDMPAADRHLMDREDQLLTNEKVLEALTNLSELSRFDAVSLFATKAIRIKNSVLSAAMDELGLLETSRWVFDEFIHQCEMDIPFTRFCIECQRRFKIVGKRRRNFVVFRRGGNRN